MERDAELPDLDEEQNHSLVEEPVYEEPPSYQNDVASSYEEIREVTQCDVETGISDEGPILRTRQPLQSFPTQSRGRLLTPNYDSDSSGSWEHSEIDEPQPPAISPTYENMSWEIGEVAGNQLHMNQSHDPLPCTRAFVRQSYENDSQYEGYELEEVDENPLNTAREIDDPLPCTSNFMKNDNQYEGYEWGEMEGYPSNTDDEKIYHREHKRHYEVVDRGFLVGEDANPKRPLLFPKRREDKEIWILGGPTHVKSNPAWVRHCQVNLRSSFCLFAQERKFINAKLRTK